MPITGTEHHCRLKKQFYLKGNDCFLQPKGTSWGGGELRLRQGVSSFAASEGHCLAVTVPTCPQPLAESPASADRCWLQTAARRLGSPGVASLSQDNVGLQHSLCLFKQEKIISIKEECSMGFSK